jgi:hypothetical protein
MRRIIIKVRNGLSNRLFALSSAWAIAKLTGRDLNLIWQPEPACGCEYYDLFSNPIKLISDGLLSSDNIEYYNYLREEGGNRYLLIDPFVEKDIFAESAHTLILRRKLRRIFSKNGLRTNFTWAIHRYTKFVFFRYLRINETLRNIADQYDTSGAIGVHVRIFDDRSPKVDFPEIGNIYKRATLDLYINRIRQEIQKNSLVKIFLACNSDDIEFKLHKEFGQRIFIYPKRSRRRSSKMAIEDAVVDLYLLSRTKKIIGAWPSTFPLLASKWGRIPYESVVEELDNRVFDVFDNIQR